MDTRRSFLKKSMLFSGAAGMSGVFPESIRRAASILPDPGTTYLDAEHVIILMQENRSFDHCFGTLRGVRGFNDPRAIRLPNKNSVWLQTNDKDQTFVPYRFNIKDSKATWLGSTPHNRSSQVDAWNKGSYDNWLAAKRVNKEGLRNIPLTFGYYNREDLPFHYALADAFTVCDQNFCSAMTGTNPNRLFFWTGTCRDSPNEGANVYIRNLKGDWRWAALTFDTFPERLENNGISWKFYQNEIRCGWKTNGERRAWLSNFGCNPLEWFKSYNVRYSPRHLHEVKKQMKKAQTEILELKKQLEEESGNESRQKKLNNRLAGNQKILRNAKEELQQYSRSHFEKLSKRDKDLYERAFTINNGDADYLKLTSFCYDDAGKKRTLSLPKGDVLYQFRKDVESGNLPTVSWLAAPKNFSDHPEAPWYGSYYLSEILDILTKNPEVWKKTIFLLTFDENDGYFDHIPPYTAPDPKRPETGKCSDGITTDEEYIHLEDELKKGVSKKEAREGPVGLGFRVPMIIASPWSRGGVVCSELFDHTSTLQFLEDFCYKKFGKHFKEENISDWRRTITGNLTSAFRPYEGEKGIKLPFLKQKPFIQGIYNAKFKGLPTGYTPLSKSEINAINLDPASSAIMPKQEPGVRLAAPLPYELYSEIKLSENNKAIELTMSSGNKIFGKAAKGSPFNVYLFNHKIPSLKGIKNDMHYSCYTVKAGSRLSDSWRLDAFEKGHYHLSIYGPNGFFREFKGSPSDPLLDISCLYETRPGFNRKLSGNIVLSFRNGSAESYEVKIIDHAYGNPPVSKIILPQKEQHRIILDLTKSYHWYDFGLQISGFDHFEKRYAGKVETGKEGITDPAMGRMM